MNRLNYPSYHLIARKVTFLVFWDVFDCLSDVLRGWTYSTHSQKYIIVEKISSQALNLFRECGRKHERLSFGLWRKCVPKSTLIFDFYRVFWLFVPSLNSNDKSLRQFYNFQTGKRFRNQFTKLFSVKNKMKPDIKKLSQLKQKKRINHSNSKWSKKAIDTIQCTTFSNTKLLTEHFPL